MSRLGADRAREIIKRERDAMAREGKDDAAPWCARATNKQVAEGIWECLTKEGALKLPPEAIVELLASFVGDIRDGERLKREQS